MHDKFPIDLLTAYRTRCVVRWLTWTAACWIVMVALPSFPRVRGWLSLPLYVHDEQAQGDLAYVMAGGVAYMERLRAAADLYHMHRIDEIYLLDEQQATGYDFVHHRSQKKVERATAYLGLLGIPRNVIRFVPEQENAWMGSLSEAQMFTANRPQTLSSLVVVTSAPHTRRSRLCFRRSLPSKITVHVYAASPPAQSAEIYMPLWHEYLKLLVYSIVA